MHGRAVALAMTAAALALTGPVPAAPAAGAGQNARETALRIESALLTEMNLARTARGRAALRPLATLQRPARGQSGYLVGIGALTHTGRDGSPFWVRLVAAGFPRGRSMAENLAMVPGCGADAARRTVRMWLASPGHRANLLNPRFRWVGAGSASARDCSSTVLTADYGS